eukprot:gene6650-9129_t
MSSEPTVSTSPIRGIERLSEELKSERQKASVALQDRARLRIEIESLKQIIDRQIIEIKDYQIANEELQQELAEKTSKLLNAQNLADGYEKELQTIKYEIRDNRNDTSEKLDSYEKVVQDNNEKSLLISKLQSSVDNFEQGLATKDNMMKELKNEIANLRRNQSAIEQRSFDNLQQLKEQAKSNQELKSKVDYALIIEDNYEQSKFSNEELRSELENALVTIANLSHDLREANKVANESVYSIESMKTQLYSVISEKDQLITELEELENHHDELLSRIEVEIETTKSAQSHAEAATRGKDFAEKQLSQLRETHQDAIQRAHKSEELCNESKSKISNLTSELNLAYDRIAELEDLTKGLQGMQSMMSEIDSLRNQLNEMKKQLIKRDLEDEAGNSAPRMILERENSGRQVYEGIIMELRSEIDKISNKYFETNRKLEESLRKATRVDQLEEEVQMYKEMAKNVTEESQNFALSASEAVERSIKYAHEKQNILHGLSQVEADLHNVRLENQRLKDELNTMREKMRGFHSSKLTSDKKASELAGINSRLEANIEDLKQQLEIHTLDLDKSKRIHQEQHQQIIDLKLKSQEIEKYKQEISSLSNKLFQSQVALQSNDGNYEREIESLQQSKLTLQNEIDSMKASIESYKQVNDHSLHEIKKLHNDIESVSIDRDKFKREATLSESIRAEAQLNDLKRDLELTVNEWKNLEKEKSSKDKINNQLTADLLKEKEKSSLLKMQIGLSEERVRVLTQELQVYRSLDIYHSSMQVELQSYRNESNSKSKYNKLIKDDIPNITSDDEYEQEINNNNNTNNKMNTRNSVMPEYKSWSQSKEKDNMNNNNSNNNNNNNDNNRTVSSHLSINLPLSPTNNSIRSGKMSLHDFDLHSEDGESQSYNNNNNNNFISSNKNKESVKHSQSEDTKDSIYSSHNNNIKIKLNNSNEINVDNIISERVKSRLSYIDYKPSIKSEQKSNNDSNDKPSSVVLNDLNQQRLARKAVRDQLLKEKILSDTDEERIEYDHQSSHRFQKTKSSRDLSYKPSQTDFERARRLLSK